MDQDFVAPLLDHVMTWIEEGTPVDTIANRIRRHLPDPPDRVRLIKELRRRAHRLSPDDRQSRAQPLERIVEAMERAAKYVARAVTHRGGAAEGKGGTSAGGAAP